MIMKITFTGQARTRMAPEEGRSAIAAASRAIADMRLGRLDEETTANVGTIRGGLARNIVPESCVLDAEARSHDEAKLADLVQEMVDACSFAASLTGCEVEAEVNRGFHGYRFAKSDEPVRLAEGRFDAAGTADVHPLRRRCRREHLQHAGPRLPEPLERYGRITPLRAHRRFRPGRDGQVTLALLEEARGA
jgi:metal-dependent amidase/aminoacylase/carboxypeptidase family protein